MSDDATLMRCPNIAVAVVAFVVTTAAAQPVQKEANAIPKAGTGTGGQAEDDCGSAGTWQGANCLDTRIKRLDVTLNAAYKRALVGQTSRGLAEELRKSQREWLRYVNANCDFVGAWEGVSGAGASFHKQSCVAREYGTRIEFLKRVADEP